MPEPAPRPAPRPVLRLLCAAGTATALLATALLVPDDPTPTEPAAASARSAGAPDPDGAGGAAVPGSPGAAPGPRRGSLVDTFDAAKAAAGLPHQDPPGTPPHRHDDPRTKNEVSRSADEPGAATEETRDPTTPEQRRTAEQHVAAERALPDPELTTVPVTAPRARVPQDRYAMAGGCYRLAGEPVFFQATALGSYLLLDAGERLIAADGARRRRPGPATVWTAREDGPGRFVLGRGGERLVLGGQSSFALVASTGCAEYPEAQVDVEGDPHAGVTPYQEVRGYVDAHTHHMAFEFLGGKVHCGRPWHEYGAPYALRDCPDHTATAGIGGVLESVLSGEPAHDPVGWPTFRDWPAPESLTHEGTYYRWLERAWRGGQRLFVNLLVENNQLCNLYPLKRNSCDDMTSIRLQAKRAREFQDYVDAQFGGPGRGFYRIVTTPQEAREVINAGKMAVVLGVETSVPFGCSVKLDVPQCDAADIDREVEALHRLGIRQMELVNKFDNALSGVAGDLGAVGPLVNLGNFLETGSFWDMRHCEPEDGDSHDNNQPALPDVTAGQQDALFGAILELTAGLPRVALPLYPPPAHCNARGLTTLGEHTLAALADRGILFDPDHMSVKARRSALDTLEERGYGGVLSSHSWSTPDAYPRIYRAGGFVAPYAGDSTGFVEKWRRHLGWADPRYYFGFGFGADINGLGAQGNPRGAEATNPVRYPFEGLNGVRVDRQRAGKRVYDINVDGVAQYGLYPDWIEDLRQVAGDDGDAIVADLARGAEAYLQTWERATGIRPDACRNPELRQDAAALPRLVRRGMTTGQVMAALGQPYQRLGRTFRTCARTASSPRVEVRIELTPGGRVASLVTRR